MKLGNFDWRILKRYLGPEAAQDLNAFLEGLPHQVGHSLLIVAGVVWGSAGALGLYTAVQTQQLIELRAELEEMQTVKPNVPEVRNVAERSSKVKEFVQSAKKAYPDVNMRVSGSTVYLTAKDTRFYPQFREAIGHIQNGGQGWRVDVEDMCVGRDCSKNPLAIQLKVNKVSIETRG